MKKFETSYILLCDNASVDSTGKMNMMGIFDIIYSKVFPAIHGRSYLVGNFKVLDNTINNIELTFLLLDHKDNNTGLNDVKLNIDFSNKAPEDKKANFLLELNGLKFAEPGTYQFVVRTNHGEDIGICKFQVVKPKE